MDRTRELPDDPLYFTVYLQEAKAVSTARADFRAFVQRILSLCRLVHTAPATVQSESDDRPNGTKNWRLTVRSGFDVDQADRDLEDIRAEGCQILLCDVISEKDREFLDTLPRDFWGSTQGEVYKELRAQLAPILPKSRSW